MSAIRLYARRGLALRVLLFPVLLVTAIAEAAPQSSGPLKELTQEKMDSIISAIRAARDAVTIRCIGKKDTNFFTISESMGGIYRTNTAINDGDFFLENFAWLEDGHRFASRVIFQDNNIIFGTLQDDKPIVEMNLDRTNLTMSQDLSLFGIPFHDGAQCEVAPSGKQL